MFCKFGMWIECANVIRTFDSSDRMEEMHMTQAIGKKKTFMKKRGAGGRSEQYIDLGAMVFEDEAMETYAGTTFKVAEIYRYEDVKTIIKHLYDGHSILIDYTSLANDDLAMKRISTELSSVAEDINGDLAGIGNNLLLATANGIRIDRNKIRGSY